MKSSPWGHVQDEQPIAEGIIRVSTASHGGYHCTGKAQKAIEAAVPGFTPFAGRGWYEEDCDWAVVALICSPWFDDASIDAAVRTIQPVKETGYLTPVREWLNGESREALLVRLRAKAYADIHAEDYDVGSMGSVPAGYPREAWSVGLRQRTSGERRRIIMAGYPDKMLYTAGELDALDITHQTPVKGV